jgi:hypothetical protein
MTPVVVEEWFVVAYPAIDEVPPEAVVSPVPLLPPNNADVMSLVWLPPDMVSGTFEVPAPAFDTPPAAKRFPTIDLLPPVSASLPSIALWQLHANNCSAIR